MTFQDRDNAVGKLQRVWEAVMAFYSSITFSYVNPLLEKGAANELDENSAASINPLTESIEELTMKFYQIFNKLENDADNCKKTPSTNPVIWTLIRQHTSLILTQFVLLTGALCSRLLGPLSIRWFLVWLGEYKDQKEEIHDGWLWGFFLAVAPIGIVLFIHQFYW
eukprot:g7115.t1